jgi:hypothetical protein
MNRPLKPKVLVIAASFRHAEGWAHDDGRGSREWYYVADAHSLMRHRPGNIDLVWGPRWFERRDAGDLIDTAAHYGWKVPA